MENTQEIWKDVVGYEGFYQVSNKGNAMSLGRIILDKNGVSRNTKAKLMRLLFNKKNGYLKITPCLNYKCKQYYVHRLIASAFIPNPENKKEVNHINGIKTDNRVENLEWATAKENMQHAVRTGLNDLNGENSTNSKLTNEQVLKIRELSSQGMSATKIKKEIGIVSSSQIWNIVARKAWKHI